MALARIAPAHRAAGLTAGPQDSIAGVPSVPSSDFPDPLAELRARFLSGEVGAGEKIVAALEAKLVDMARRTKRQQSPSVSLQTQDLVDEAVLKLLRRPPNLKDDKHFLCYLARTMRSVLTDYHRQRARRRAAESQFMNEKVLAYEQSMRHDLPLADELLQGLRAVRPLGAQILELNVFGNQPHGAIAKALNLSKTTVEREARASRLWLKQELARG